MAGRIYRNHNRIHFEGDFGLAELHRPLASLHRAIQEAGFQDIVLDFSQCTAAYSGPMLALCAQVMKLQQARIDFDLVLPEDQKLRRLFLNTNWAHYLSPRTHQSSTFKGHTQIPATHYVTPEEQRKAVNRIVNAILGAIPDIERSDFAALEWSINEITDNVLVHAKSPIGGLVQVSTFQRNRKRLEYIVADAGVGIPNTLREGHPEIATDLDALDLAIREGVTRDTNVGQGNGLYGSYQICSHSKGFFEIASGRAKLVYTEARGLHIGREQVPFEGTLVAAVIDFSVPRLLEEALKFDGRIHSPVDYIETKYEAREDVVFVMKEESTSFGSRVAGTPLRNKLTNLSRMCRGQKVTIDFSDIPLISSSFADEVIGKLFSELGPLEFMRTFQLRGVASTVQKLIDKAIAQRMAVSK